MNVKHGGVEMLDSVIRLSGFRSHWLAIASCGKQSIPLTLDNDIQGVYHQAGAMYSGEGT